MAKRQEVVPSICRVFKTVLPIGQIRLQKGVLYVREASMSGGRGDVFGKFISLDRKVPPVPILVLGNLGEKPHPSGDNISLFSPQFGG